MRTDRFYVIVENLEKNKTDPAIQMDGRAFFCFRWFSNAVKTKQASFEGEFLLKG